MRAHRRASSSILGAASWVLGIATGLAAGCQSIGNLFKSEKVDYTTAGKLPPLEVPPDLTRPSGDNRYAVPDRPGGGSATYSVYNAERSGRAPGGPVEVLPNVEKVRLQRAGGERWLVVPDCFADAAFSVSLS